MSAIVDYHEECRAAAQRAIHASDAGWICRFHPDVFVSRGDPDLTSKAYAIGTNMVKNQEVECLREDLMAAIHTELDLAADGSCPACDHLAAM